MKVLSRTITTAVVAAGTLLLAARPSHAIPAWARATGAPCISCHFGASNRLTKMGFDFLSRGHRMPGEEGFTEENAGDTNLLHYLSLSARGSFSSQKDRDPSSQFSTDSFGLLAGGPLMKNLSFWADYDFGTSPGDTDLGALSLEYTSDLTTPAYWWARAGKFNPEITRIGWRVPGGTGTALSAPAGLNNPFRPSSNQNGLSAGYVTGKGLYTELGVVDGLSAGPGNNHKDAYLSAFQMLDEYGSGVGLYGYSGQYTYASDGATNKADFSRYGVLGQYMRDKWEALGAYYSGKSDIRNDGSHKPSAWNAEFDYNVLPDQTAYIQYSKISNDIPTDILTPTITTSTKNWSLGYALRYTEWARFTLALSSTKTENPSDNHTVNSASLGWSFWF